MRLLCLLAAKGFEFLVLSSDFLFRAWGADPVAHLPDNTLLKAKEAHSFHLTPLSAIWYSTKSLFLQGVLMFHPSLDEFKQKAKQGNLIPVYREILADMETPVSAFLKIDDGKNSFLLESMEGGEKWARYSFLGSRPSVIVKTSGRQAEIVRSGKTTKLAFGKDPLEIVKNVLAEYMPVPEPVASALLRRRCRLHGLRCGPVFRGTAVAGKRGARSSRHLLHDHGYPPDLRQSHPPDQGRLERACERHLRHRSLQGSDAERSTRS